MVKFGFGRGGDIIKLIYLAHPYGGKDENIQSAKKIHELLGGHIFNPVMYYPMLKELYPESVIMELCLDMLSRCDELVVCEGWENSLGCQMEIEHAKALNKSIRYFKVGEV